MSTEVKVPKLPHCDMCGDFGRHNLAQYDSRISGTSTWAYMCDTCYAAFGVNLGTGSAQRLVLAEKKDVH
jgi:hypothetical protein